MKAANQSMANTTELSHELSRISEVLGISPKQLANVLETDPRTVYRWLADQTYPQHESRKHLHDLIQLENRLIETFGTSEGVQTWLSSSTRYFGGLRPLDALLRGRIDTVDAALEAIDSGVYV